MGDITFKEAYEKSGRILNISVSASHHAGLLNYLTTPNVVVWSAAAASCAIPYIFPSVELVEKGANGQLVAYSGTMKFMDGSVASDLPMKRIAELFNVNHFIVSQVNPHIAPFMKTTTVSQKPSRPRYGFDKLWYFLSYLINSEIKHRVIQLCDIGLLPSSIATQVVRQEYRGDITIIPEIYWKNLLSLLSNPTPELIHEYSDNGAHSTYPKIPLIKSHCLIEVTLDTIFNDVKRRMSKKELNKQEIKHHI